MNKRIYRRSKRYTASSILSLRTELNAFLKSNFTTASCGCMLSMYCLAAWTAASAPSKTPYPNCRGAKRFVIFPTTILPANLATNRRRVQPTVIGRIPPPFLFRAVREAPKKKERIRRGVLPSRTREEKAAKAVRREESVSLLPDPSGAEGVNHLDLLLTH